VGPTPIRHTSRISCTFSQWSKQSQFQLESHLNPAWVLVTQKRQSVTVALTARYCYRLQLINHRKLKELTKSTCPCVLVTMSELRNNLTRNGNNSYAAMCNAAMPVLTKRTFGAAVTLLSGGPRFGLRSPESACFCREASLRPPISGISGAAVTLLSGGPRFGLRSPELAGHGSCQLFLETKQVMHKLTTPNNCPSLKPNDYTKQQTAALCRLCTLQWTTCTLWAEHTK